MDVRELTKEQFEMKEKLIELENKDRKLDQQRTMVMIILLSSIAAVIGLYAPGITESRIAALEPVIQTFLGANAVIVTSFFGAAAYQNTKKPQ